MDISEVLSWLEGSRVAERIRSVMERRQQLFESNSWRGLLEELSQYR